MLEKLECKPSYCISFSSPSTHANGTENPDYAWRGCGDGAKNYSGDPVAIYRNGVKVDQTPENIFSKIFQYKGGFQNENYLGLMTLFYWPKAQFNKHQFENHFKKCFYDVDVENDVFELKKGFNSRV